MVLSQTPERMHSPEGDALPLEAADRPASPPAAAAAAGAAHDCEQSVDEDKLPTSGRIPPAALDPRFSFCLRFSCAKRSPLLGLSVSGRPAQYEATAQAMTTKTAVYPSISNWQTILLRWLGLSNNQALIQLHKPLCSNTKT